MLAGIMSGNFRFWILFASLLYVSEGLSVGEITTVCAKNDPNLDNCVLKTANQLGPKLAKGIKSLRIPPMDPMIIPKIHLASGGNGPVSLDSTFTDVHVEGLSTYQIKKIHIDFAGKEIKTEAYVPKLYTRGKYQTNGRILTLPITGSGDSHSTYTGVKAYLNLKFKPEFKNGQEYWNLEKSDFDLDVDHADINLDNLFNGNKQLSDTMKAVISENWQVVFQELKPTVTDTVNAIATDLVSKVFKTFSLEELFPQ